MITAIDTNILLDVLTEDPSFASCSENALQSSADEGSLVICDLVYAELCAHFRERSGCDRFLDDARVRVENLSRESSFLASRIWRQYRKSGGKRERVLGDFLVGAHAQLQATRLLTRDRGFFGKLFPQLQLFDPSRD